ncbi:MAG: nucleoside kinase [Eubacteriales bacterium]|nr:nucleoside kinase [Eubacteriales bacterium]
MKDYFYVLRDGVNTEKFLAEEGTRLCDIAADSEPHAICALMDGSLVSLADVPKKDAKVRFLSPFENEQASRVFLRGATFLLYCAAKALFPKRALLVDHMLCGGVYCGLGKVTANDVAVLQKKMDEYIAEDKDFVPQRMSVDAAKKIILEEGLIKKAEILAFRPFDYYNLYSFDGRRNYFHGIMPKSAGYLKGARLFLYASGFMLKFPSPYTEAGTAIIDQPKYAAVFAQAEKWAGVLSASYVADINNMLLRGEITDFINVNEALHEKTIADIAGEIAGRKKARVVLIAGPSSSGKTTFASRLAVHLRVLGKKCRPISIDDYYKNRADMPTGENGDIDFECLDALDLAKLNADLAALLMGETARMPKFDFVTGERKDQCEDFRIDGDILIIEGIHGLNDTMTKDIPANMKFKIFISPLTALNIDDHSVVFPEDLRLLRRLARDKRTRGYSFAHTFAAWDSVRRGEYKYILPYQETADVMFNSTLLYEPLILKRHCYSELRRFTPDMPNYPEALSLLKFLNYFLSARDEDAIPPQSILREFIGK